ncbi:MAG: zinc ribbon domain-containing protein [Halodesulfurarchaeum sp.]
MTAAFPGSYSPPSCGLRRRVARRRHDPGLDTFAGAWSPTKPGRSGSRTTPRSVSRKNASRAGEYGIHVESANPVVSSQTCSKCAHTSSANRDRPTGWFESNECG